MANEVRITATGTNKSSPMFDELLRDTKKVEKSTSSLADRGLNRARQGFSGFAEQATKGAAVLAGVTAAAATVDKVMGDGIAVSLSKANAQVALGDKGFASLSDSAGRTANSMGLTESEFLRMGGQAASLAKNLGFSQEAAASFGSALPTLGSRLSILSNGQTSAADAADQLRSAIAGEFDPLQAMGIAISAASVQTEALAIQQKSATKISQQQATAMAVLAIVQRQTADASKVMGTEAGRAAREAAEAQAELKQSYEELSEKAVPVLKELTQAGSETVQAITGLADGSQSLVDRLGAAAEVADALVNPFKMLTDRIGESGEKTKEHAEASSADAVNVEKLAEGATAAAESQDALAKATSEAVDAIKDQIDVALGGRDAARGYQEAIDEASESLHDNGKTLDITTEKGRANSEALDRIAKAALDQAEAVRRAGGSEQDYRGQLERSRGQLIRTAESFGMSKTAARQYANQILGIPKKYDTRVKLDAAGALETAREVRYAIGRIKGKTVYVNIRETTFRSAEDIAHSRGEHRAGGVAGGGAAAGGARGGMVLVGEEGPELVNLGAGAFVRTAGATRSMMAGAASGGGGMATLEINSAGGDLDELFLRVIQRIVRRKGGNVQVVFGTRRGSLTAS